MERLAFIDEHRGEHSLEALCRVFGVSRSGYYAARSRQPSARACADAELATEISVIFSEHKQRYGSVRIERVLRANGRCCGRKRVARIMRQEGLRASAPPRFVRTTDSRHDGPIAPNLLERDFSASAPNQKWAGDITYIHTGEGWLYLAVVLDLFSRRVVGWSMSDRVDGELAHAAMLMALQARQPERPLAGHTDRGSTYVAKVYRDLLKAWSVTPSMSNKGDCYDNAVSESFFATLKKELVYTTRYATRAEARQSIFEYIEAYYNRKRLHSTIGYCSPVDFENDWFAKASATEKPADVENPLPMGEFSMAAGGLASTAFSNNVCPH